MPAYQPIVRNVEYVFYISLEDFSNPGSFKSSATLAAGDWKVSKDGGALANLTTLPAVTPAASTSIKITLSATEMDADNVYVVGIDQTSPKEWADYSTNIQTATATRGYAGTALPNAAADAAGGLAISDAGGLDLDAKLANTNEITAARMGALTDWINGGRLDLILDIIAADTTTDIPALIATLQTYVDTEVAAIKAKTDQLTFTVSNQVDANALSGGGGLDAAGVRSAIGLASANLDTQLGDLPTNAELNTALGTADDAVLAAIAALTAPDGKAAIATEVLAQAAASPIAANIKKVNDVTIQGTGAVGTDEWRKV